MKIQAVVTLSTTEEPPAPLDFSDQKTRETMAVVQRVIEDTGADTDTFCKWLMSSKVKVGGPLSGICHWFTSPERSTERRNSHYNILTHRHDLSRHEFDIMSSSTGPQRTSTYSSLSHINESTSISIIMILATVLFILIITAFVTCIIRKKRRPQHQPGPRSPAAAVPMSGVMVRKDKPPDYNSVIMMKEREDEELPTYCQAVSSVSEVVTSDHSESRTESDDNDDDSDIKTKAATQACSSEETDQSKSSTLS